MKEIWEIIKYTKSFRSFYIIMAIAVVILALLNQVAPLLTKQIVDLIVAKFKGKIAPIQTLLTLLLLILISDVTITILTALSQYYSDIMTAKLNKYLSEKYYRHVLSLSIEYFDNEITGKIV